MNTASVLLECDAANSGSRVSHKSIALNFKGSFDRQDWRECVPSKQLWPPT